jgi:hypothetical protein
MPLISDINKDKSFKKNFKKVPYRPWGNDETILQSDSPENIDNSEELVSSSVNDTETVNILSKTVISTALDLKKVDRSLFGAQRSIFLYLIQNIEEYLDEYVITKCITTEDLNIRCDLLPTTIKATLQKLKAKGLIDTFEKKTGRGGFARYRINSETHSFFNEQLKLPQN